MEKQKYKPPPCTLMRTIVTNLYVDEPLDTLMRTRVTNLCVDEVLDNSSRTQSHRPIPGAIEPSA